MAIDAQTVKDLRDRTGLPMMKCKAALTETNGDAEKAIELLRKEGLKAADKRSERENNEGLIATLTQDHKLAVVELKCETDFVGKNQDFKDFANNLCAQILANGNENVGSQKYTRNPAITIDQALQELTLKIGEKISLGRTLLETGLFSFYVHHNNKQAAILKVTGDAKLSENEEVKDILKGICQHIVFSNPQFVSSAQIPEEEVSKVKARFLEESAAELQGKPENIQEKILSSKLKKFFGEVCLLDQKYIRDEKKSIDEALKAVAKSVNASLAIERFSIINVGK